MSLRGDIQALLEADATISGLLAGGVHATREISRELTPGAFDANGELQPCALVKLSSSLVLSPADIGELVTLWLFFYERDTFTAIDQCIQPTVALLHEAKVGDATERVFQVRFSGSVRDQEDQALGSNLHRLDFTIARRTT